MRPWSSGRILAYQASDPGSTPGERNFLLKIEILGFKIWYSRNKNEYTREQKVNDNNKKSYLDYMITYGIDNLCFNILDKLVITDHRALSIEFLEDKKRKLDRVKEIIEPYNIANNKIDDISNKLIDVFKSEVLRARIFRQHLVRMHFGGPLGFDFVASRLILCPSTEAGEQ